MNEYESPDAVCPHCGWTPFDGEHSHTELQPAPPIGEWIPLVSSNIHSVRYHADRRDMDVRFLNGAVYTYFDVDLEIFRGLVENRRPASYLAIYVKQRLRYRLQPKTPAE